jgi:hypothetical protein
MEINCLAVSFCVEIYASGVGFGYGFNLLCPCSWCFKFFLLFQQCSSEMNMLDMLPFVGFLLWWQLPLSSLSEGLEFQIFNRGTGALLQFQGRMLGLCALWRVGFLVPAK